MNRPSKTNFRMDQPNSTHGGHKIRASCDRCQAAKLKCGQNKPACSRCIRGGHKCVYSPYKRIGRPPISASNPDSNPQHGKTSRPKKLSTSQSSESPRNMELHQEDQLSSTGQDDEEKDHQPLSCSELEHNDVATSYLNDLTFPGDIAGSSEKGNSEFDMAIQMTFGDSCEPQLSNWSINTPAPSGQHSLLDSMLDIDQFDLELSPTANPAVTTLPTTTSLDIHISSGYKCASDNLTSGFEWEADLFGGGGFPLPAVAIEERTGMQQTLNGVSSNTRNGSADSEAVLSIHQSPQSGMVDHGSSHLKRKSIGPDDRHQQGDEPVRSSTSSQQYRRSYGHGSVSSSYSSSPRNPFQSTVRPPSKCQRTRKESTAHITPVIVSPPNSEEGSKCGVECYSALLDQLTRLVECDGGDELSLDALLSLSRDLDQKKSRALTCADCMAKSTSRTMLILTLTAMNNLVGLFEQKLNPPEKEDEDCNDSDERLAPASNGAWHSIARASGRKGQLVGAAGEDDAVGSTLLTDTPLMAGTFVVEGKVKARFLHDLLSLSLERLVALLTELDQVAHSALKDVNYRIAREMLKDLPSRIFFMRGRLALAESAFA